MTIDWSPEVFRRLSLVQEVFVVLFVSSTALFIAGILRQPASSRPYFSGLFVLGLCPFIFCSLAGFARLFGLGDPDAIANIGEMLHDVERPFWLGTVTSAVLLALYSLAHILHSRKSPLEKRLE